MSDNALRLIGAFKFVVQSATLADSAPRHMECCIEEPWKPIFWAEVAIVARALLAEGNLEKGKFSMVEWLKLRVLTISGK